MMYELLVDEDKSLPPLGQDPTAAIDSDGSCISNPTYKQQQNAREFYGTEWAAIGCSPGRNLTMMYVYVAIILRCCNTR
jgi:hypothetical protein